MWPDAPSPDCAGVTVWRGITAHPVRVSVDIDQTYGHEINIGRTRLRDDTIEWHAVARASPDPPP